VEMGAELAAGQIPVLAQSLLDDTGGASHGAWIQAELAVVGGHPAVYLGCGEIQHPLDVGSADKVPGGTEDVSAEDSSPVDGALDGSVGRAPRRAKSESPLGRPILLRLHRSEPGDHILHPTPARPRDPLVLESQVRNR
jgi:hypothetical protein